MSTEVIITTTSPALAPPEEPWDQARYDNEIRAARQQMARGAAEIAEGNVRLAIVLLRLRATMEYRRWGFESLESYIGRVHNISNKTAYTYLRTLESLGPDLMRQLIRDAGMQRTLWMALIRDQSEQTFEELLTPAPGGQPIAASLEVRELERINAELSTALEEAYQRYSNKADELTATQQISQATRTRLSEIDVHNRDLVLARDRAQREQERAEKQQAREKELRLSAQREAERKVAALERQLRELSEKLRTPAAPSQLPAPIQVIGGTDPRLLVAQIQLFAQAIHGANARALHIAPEQAQEFGKAIGEIIEAGVPAVLLAALKACAVAVRAALETEALSTAETLALREALNEFARMVAPALGRREERHG